MDGHVSSHHKGRLSHHTFETNSRTTHTLDLDIVSERTNLGVVPRPRSKYRHRTRFDSELILKNRKKAQGSHVLLWLPQTLATAGRRRMHSRSRYHFPTVGNSAKHGGATKKEGTIKRKIPLFIGSYTLQMQTQAQNLRIYYPLLRLKR